MNSAHVFNTFEKNQERDYLANLHDSFSLFVNHINNSNTFPDVFFSYYQEFNDILGMFSLQSQTSDDSFRFKTKLSISKYSGMPMHSNIFEIAQNKKKLKKLSGRNIRKKKDIVNDILDSIYENDDKSFNIFSGELKKYFYVQRSKNISNFNDRFEFFEEDIRKNKPGLKKYSLNIASYPLDEMSCVTLNAQFYKISNFFSFGEIPKNKIKKSLSNSVDVIYEKISHEKNLFPLILKKSQPSFYFEDLNSSDSHINKLASMYGPILEVKFDNLENSTQLLVENKEKLLEVSKYAHEDVDTSQNFLYVAPSAAKKDLSDFLLDNNISHRVIYR